MLRGTLIERDGSRGILDVSGVGYEVFAPGSVLDGWTVANSEVRAHIYTQVAEDTLSLYGFESAEQRLAFVTLLSVSGVGPKVALAALETLAVGELARAVDAGDFAALGRIKGVGKKTAQRIALELKGKLPNTTPLSPLPSSPSSEDALPLALDRLGYSRAEIAKAVAGIAAQGLGSEDTVSVRLKAALAVLSGSRS